MKYISSKEFALKWKISDRMVRNYCREGKIPGSFLKARVWYIPFDAKKPVKSNLKKVSDNNLLNILKEEKDIKLSGGIYHETQILLTYNSNHIEGSTLTPEQTRFIFETNTVDFSTDYVKADDVVETSNHFKCVDFIIDNAMQPLTEAMIKKIHFYLKSGTSDDRLKWFNTGKYKIRRNYVGGRATCSPEKVKEEMKKLLADYNSIKHKSLENILDFHKKFEDIHPFTDGNGRVGRLIMFKECLANNIVPFIIDEAHKDFYYRGLRERDNDKGYLIDTCLSCQDEYKKLLDDLGIEY